MPIFRALSAALSAIGQFFDYIGISFGFMSSLLSDLFGLNKLLN